MDSPALPAVLTGAPSPAFPVRKTAGRFSLRFYAGMARREASGARCEPATGDVRSAQARLTAGRAGCQHPGNIRSLPADRRPVPHRNRSPAGNCGPAHCHRQVPVPGQFFPCFPPVFFPEFPEKSGRDWLAAHRPHSQPYRRRPCSRAVSCRQSRSGAGPFQHPRHPVSRWSTGWMQPP